MKSKEEILELIRNYKFGDDPQSAEELVDIVVDKFYQQTESLRKEVELLKDTLHIDQTGLAKALESVVKVCDSYHWVTEGRGPYAWNDDEYRNEMLRMLEDVRSAAVNGLNNSGSLAHSVCCGKDRRKTVVEDLQQEVERLKGDLEAYKSSHGTLAEGYAKALSYIDQCPCDPDIYPDQLKAWTELQDFKSNNNI